MKTSFKRLLRGLALIVIVGAAGGAAFVLGVRLRGGGGTEALDPRSDNLNTRIGAAQTAIATDAGKPTFVGELLGIAFAPTEDKWPEQVRKEREERATAFATCGPDSLAPPNPFPFANALELPAKFATAGTLAATGRPEVVTRCGEVTGVNWEYQATNEDGTPASLYVNRRVGRELLYDGSADRMSVTAVAGLPAVVIAPVTPGGFVQQGRVVFPEPFGMTTVETFNLSQADLLAVAERVGAAIGGGAR